MRNFLILFKHEMKMQFPRKSKKEKLDISGMALSLLATLLVAVVFIVLVSTIVQNYVLVEINKVPAPMQRGKELLNFFYVVILLTIAFTCMEKMRSTLTQKKDKELFLRLPVKPQTLFMSKLCTLLVWTYIFAFVLIIAVNIIFFIVLKPSFLFWLYTLLAWLLMPMAAFLLATVLLVPYIKLIDFISEKYWLIFLILSGIVIGAFVLYSGLLGILQSLLETGSIKFLFNQDFINALQSLLIWTYPANCFASIVLGENMRVSLWVTGIIAGVSLVAVYFVSKKLFYATLYKNESKHHMGKKQENYVARRPLFALIKKEFISVFREPKHLFSYFSIATAMPVMVYCCYTLFESLIRNAIGLKVNFALALLVLLIFSILTNTFCATNITRDGRTALKSKMLPVKASKLMFAKVLFCAIVSSAAVAASTLVLIITSLFEEGGLAVKEALLCGLVAFLFSMAQIFIATRMDLNHAKVTALPAETEKITNRTVSKVVFLGLALALTLGVLSMCISIFAKMTSIPFIASLHLQESYAYYLPLIGSFLYFAFGLFYYAYRIEKSFDSLVA